MAHLNQSETINARDIVNDPDAHAEWTGMYVLISDTSMTANYRSLIMAINLLADRGWEVVSTDYDNVQMYALLKRVRTVEAPKEMD